MCGLSKRRFKTKVSIHKKQAIGETALTRHQIFLMKAFNTRKYRLSGACCHCVLRSLICISSITGMCIYNYIYVCSNITFAVDCNADTLALCEFMCHIRVRIAVDMSSLIFVPIGRDNSLSYQPRQARHGARPLPQLLSPSRAGG